MAIKDELLEINEILQQWLEGGMTEEEAMRHIIVVVAKQLTSMLVVIKNGNQNQ
jgi:hypothetical protein